MAPDLKAIALHLYNNPGWQPVEDPNRASVLRSWGWARGKIIGGRYHFHLTAKGRQEAAALRDQGDQP